MKKPKPIKNHLPKILNKSSIYGELFRLDLINATNPAEASAVAVPVSRTSVWCNDLSLGDSGVGAPKRKAPSPAINPAKAAVASGSLDLANSFSNIWLMIICVP